MTLEVRDLSERLLESAERLTAREPAVAQHRGVLSERIFGRDLRLQLAERLVALDQVGELALEGLVGGVRYLADGKRAMYGVRI